MSSDEKTNGEERDTILKFAEETITSKLFPKETEPTQTWLSGASHNDSSREHDGSESCERCHADHIPVDIIDPTTKRLDQGNDPILCSTTTLIGRDKPKNMNDVGVSQEGNFASNISVVTLKCPTSSSTLTDEDICSTTVSGKTAETSTSCEEVVGSITHDPVVARVRRQADGGTSSGRTCFYFCKLTGVMKIIEMIALSLALIITVGVDGAGFFSDSLIIVNGVMLMGLTVTPTLLVCYLLKQKQIQSTFFEVIINGFLALYSVVAGCSALRTLMGSDSNVAVSVALGVFLIIAGVAYVVDSVLAIFKYRSG